MFFAIKRKLRFLAFDQKVKAILETGPIACNTDGDAVFVTHVCEMYFSAYLLALKSIARYITPKMIYVIDDLSLTERSKRVLRQHAKGVEIIPITEVRNDHCPSGGDWEGFLLIGEMSSSHYCIMLDADTLTLSPLPEVLDAVHNNNSFTLGTWPDQQIVSIHEVRESVAALKSEHVQILSEKKLDKLKNGDQLKYVRGCGGFSGFAKGSVSRSVIDEFSLAMTQIVGKSKWLEWGSQQVASNYFVANTAGAVVLPFPKYASYDPSINPQRSAFVHFIGTHRFKNGVYAETARKAIKEMPRN